MKTFISASAVSLQEKNPEREIQPISPPEHPLTQPSINPEKERTEPFRPIPEVQPVPNPEIKREKSR